MLYSVVSVSQSLTEEEIDMTTAKEKMTDIIKQQPDDSSYDEILTELAFSRMIDRGLEDARCSRTISNDELSLRIRSWRK